MPQNPYASPAQAGARSRKLNRAALGLRWGFVFASPIIGIGAYRFIVDAAIYPGPDFRKHLFSLLMSGTVLLVGGAIVASGNWWGKHASRLRPIGILLAAMFHGTFWMFILAVGEVVALHCRGDVRWPHWSRMILIFAPGFPAYSVWSLLLGLVIRWRLSRAYKKRLAQRRKSAAKLPPSISGAPASPRP